MSDDQEISTMKDILRKQSEVNVLRPAKPRPIDLGEGIWWSPSSSYMRRIFGKRRSTVFGATHDIR